MKRNQSGFTLIEIAIVLVIIGLLLGGVLKGQELINSAKVKNLASDFKNTALFIYSYQDKYHALPGDDALAASHVTGAATASTPTNMLGNGRIDGWWDSATKTDESFLFWQHVRLSGIAAGVTDINDSIGYPPRNTSGGLLGVTNSAAELPITGLKGGYVICSGGILGKFAKQLDVSLDDGNTATGTMMAIADLGTHPSTTAGAPVANPIDTDLYTVCQGV
ncbi:MAG TPA: prepilin-type N-terminal cleavage/methylation domain-containing protein [Gallionella sp.]|nr:prepilin-type N-terminal cleavage/methylation domain-containing protein [Gallionella sp.]